MRSSCFILLQPLALFLNITGSFERGYEFAFNGSRLNSFGEHEVQDLLVFMKGTPQAGGGASGGETHTFMGPDGLRRMVADACKGRSKLESNDGSETFTTHELALLANMREGAVRMATSEKTDSRLRTIPGLKPVSVEFDEAERWLSGRRGFAPWSDQPVYDRFLTCAFRDAATAKAFGRLVHRVVDFQTPEAALEKIGWPAEEIQPWFDGSSRSRKVWTAAGQALRLLPPDAT